MTDGNGLRAVATDLYTEHPSPVHVIERLVPRGVVTVLGGHGGAGKSVLALTLAMHVATGRAWAGLACDYGHTLIVSLEDPGSLVNFRLRRACDAYNSNADAVTENITILDGSDGNAVLAGEAREDGVVRLGTTVAFAEVRNAAQGCDLIVIDNASDGFDADENNRRMVRAFMRELAQLARETNAGLILLTHVDKNAARYGGQGNSYSGSTAWHNGARSRLALIVADDGIVELRQEKANLGRALPGPIRLIWNDDGVLMPLAGDAHVDRLHDDTEAVMVALQAAWTAGVDVGTARQGPATTQSLLSTFTELPAHLHGAAGRKAFWAAIGKLQAVGKVTTREIITGQRKRKTVFVASDCANSEDHESARAISPHPYALYGAHKGARVCASSAPIPKRKPAQTGASADKYREVTRGE